MGKLLFNMAKNHTVRKKRSERLAEKYRRRRAALIRKFRVNEFLVHGSFIKQYVTCGKLTCCCRRGQRHGPFYYLARCLGPGKIHKFQLKSPTQKKWARKGVLAWQKIQNQLNDIARINAQLLKMDAMLVRMEIRKRVIPKAIRGKRVACVKRAAYAQTHRKGEKIKE